MTFTSVLKMLFCILLFGLQFLPARSKSVGVRLVEGYSANQGWVEVRMGDSTSQKPWRPICGDKFKEKEAMVVCHQLGYRFSQREVAEHYKDLKSVELHYFDCTKNLPDLSKCKINTCLGGKTYAWVCCSNASSFGEQIGDVFVSHCQSNWMSAQGVCEAINSTIAMETDYPMAHTTSETSIDGLDSNTANLTWIGQFFTPWIWSNGCYKLNFQSKTILLRSNSPEHCLQYCGVKAGSAFALQGDVCQCFHKGYLPLNGSRVSPGNCSRRCPGNSDQYCGASQTGHWSLYSIETRDRFSSFSSPPTPPTRQCAVLIIEPEVRLETESCNTKHGYTCSHLQGDGELRYMFLVSNLVPMTEARHKCVNDETNLRLVGNVVLSEDRQGIPNAANLWVDIERTVVSVHKADDFSVVGRIDPEWCLALRRVNWTYSEITMRACSQRLPFNCMKKRRWKPPIPTVPDDDEPLIRTTVQPNKVNDPTKTNRSVVIASTDSDPDGAGTTEAIIITSTALALVVLAFIIGVCCCRRRCSRKGDGMGNNRHYESNTTEMDLLPRNADYSSLQEESHYEEIPDKPKEDLVYHELQNYTPLQPENERGADGASGTDYETCKPFSEGGHLSNTITNQPEYDKVIVAGTNDESNCIESSKINETLNISQIVSDKNGDNDIILTDNYTTPKDFIRSDEQTGRSECKQQNSYIYPYDYLKSTDPAAASLHKPVCKYFSADSKPLKDHCSTATRSLSANNKFEHSSVKNDARHKPYDLEVNHKRINKSDVQQDQGNDRSDVMNDVMNDDDINVTYSYSLPSDFVREQQQRDKESDPYSDPYDFLKPGDNDSEFTVKQKVINANNTSSHEPEVT